VGRVRHVTGIKGVQPWGVTMVHGAPAAIDGFPICPVEGCGSEMKLATTGYKQGLWVCLRRKCSGVRQVYRLKKRKIRRAGS
jgi:hypothetical protein